MDEQIKQTNPILHRYLFTVTTFSKLLAMFLFILLPFVGFYLGMKYQDKITVTKSPTTQAKQEDKTNPTPTSTLFNSSDLVCKENSKYFVIVKDNKDMLGAYFLVKRKTNQDQKIECSYNVAKEDFEIKNLWASYFFALTDNFLVIDQGTAPPPRNLIIYNLNTQKQVYSDSYSYPASVTGDNITYWASTKEEVTTQNCPEINKYSSEGLGTIIQTHVTLNMNNLIKTGLGEKRCNPVQ